MTPEEKAKCFEQGEQKLADNVESKYEPKFHEDDWVTDGDNTTQIVAVGTGLYIINRKDMSEVSLSTKYINAWYHLWTIQDAKDGDVLFHSDSASNGIFIFKEIIDRGFAKEIICYCDYDSEDHFCLGEHHTCCWTNAKILRPATKEQRDLLEKAMAEAGYTFDFEKKELKKIEQKSSNNQFTPEQLNCKVWYEKF